MRGVPPHHHVRGPTDYTNLVLEIQVPISSLGPEELHMEHPFLPCPCYSSTHYNQLSILVGKGHNHLHPFEFYLAHHSSYPCLPQIRISSPLIFPHKSVTTKQHAVLRYSPLNHLHQSVHQNSYRGLPSWGKRAWNVGVRPIYNCLKSADKTSPNTKGEELVTLCGKTHR